MLGAETRINFGLLTGARTTSAVRNGSPGKSSMAQIMLHSEGVAASQTAEQELARAADSNLRTSCQGPIGDPTHRHI